MRQLVLIALLSLGMGQPLRVLKFPESSQACSRCGRFEWLLPEKEALWPLEGERRYCIDESACVERLIADWRSALPVESAESITRCVVFAPPQGPPLECAFRPPAYLGEAEAEALVFDHEPDLSDLKGDGEQHHSSALDHENEGLIEPNGSAFDDSYGEEWFEFVAKERNAAPWRAR